MNLYYQNYDSSPYYLFFIIHLYIIHHIKTRDIEYAFLISNYIMLKKGKGALNPYEYSHFEYKEAIKKNNLSNLMRVFLDIERTKYEKKVRLIQHFNIQKFTYLDLTQKRKNTKKSDIDFIVILNEDLIPKEKEEKIEKLIEYFKNECDSEVDVLDFSYALNTFNASKMENIVTLI